MTVDEIRSLARGLAPAIRDYVASELERPAERSEARLRRLEQLARLQALAIERLTKGQA